MRLTINEENLRAVGETREMKKQKKKKTLKADEVVASIYSPRICSCSTQEGLRPTHLTKYTPDLEIITSISCGRLFLSGRRNLSRGLEALFFAPSSSSSWAEREADSHTNRFKLAFSIAIYL